MITKLSTSNNTIEVDTSSFIANLYTIKHFRMIGLIDVFINYSYGLEKVTLAFYSSSGTNNGKIKGLWYPIAGIKLYSGDFVEFSPYVNYVLEKTTALGTAHKGWLAKSLFFYEKDLNPVKPYGFSSGKYHEDLLNLGMLLEDLYNQGKFLNTPSLTPKSLLNLLYANSIYIGNKHSQVENFDNFIHDMFIEPL